MRRFLSWPIRVHLLILVSLLAFPALILMIYSGFNERNQAIVDARGACLKFVATIAHEEQAVVAGVQQLTTTLALLPAVQSLNAEAVNPLLRDLLEKNPQYTNITIADRSGTVWAAAVPFNRKASVARLKYFQDALRSGLFSTGEYMVGRISNKPILIFGYPVKNASNKIIAVIGVGFDLEHGRSLFNMANLPAGSSFGLLDHRGIILYRHPQDAVSQKLIGNTDIREDLFTRMQDGPDEGTFEAVGSDGIFRLTAYKKIRLPHDSRPYLYIRASIPLSAATSKAQAAVFQNLLILMAVFVVGLSLAWLIGKRVIVDRILTLQKASQQLAAGKGAVDVSRVVEGGELGDLAGAFDRMAEALLAREKENQDARKSLLESEEKFSKAFYHSPILMSLSTIADGRFVEVNDQFLSVAGRTRAEIIGNNAGDINLWVDPDRREKLIEVLKNGGKVQNEPVSIRARAGNITDVLWSGEFVAISGVPYLLASAVDITGLKRAEEAVHESEQNFKGLAEQSLVGISIIQDDLLRYVNPKYAEIYGYAAEELIDTVSPWELVHPDDRQKVEESLNRRMAGQAGPEWFEAKTLKKTGEIIHVEIYGAPGGYNSKPAMIVVLLDITERKRLEEERLNLEVRLHRAAKMEALGQLAGGVAHDLNNVLGVLVGYSELLQEKLSEGNPLRRYANNILKSGIKGAAIIQDLLTLARRGVAVSEVVNLNRVVSDYFRSPEFENLKAYHPQVTFRTELERDLLNIHGSPVHLSKTVMNLVSNAAEAITERGAVTIQTENRYLDKPVRGYDDMQEGDYVLLTVRDTGRGISADDLGKIFEPFYTRKVMGRSGTGLGLAVVWGTVKDHQGTLTCRAKRARGAPLPSISRLPGRRWQGSSRPFRLISSRVGGSRSWWWMMWGSSGNLP
ncbi:MAG: PAS domain S-box protein [Syntrophales bacterium]